MTSNLHQVSGPDTVWYEDLSPGQVYQGPGRTLTETNLVMFSMVIGDHHEIHANEEYAKANGLPGRMFHGTFGIGLTIAMTSDLLRLKNPIVSALGIREWVFQAPLFVGDTVKSQLEIIDKRVTSDGRRAILDRRLKLIKQDDAVAQVGIADLMVRLAKPQAAAGQ